MGAPTTAPQYVGTGRGKGREALLKQGGNTYTTSLQFFARIFYLEKEMIKVNHVTKIFPGGVKALDDVTLHIQKGSIYGIVGLSGAGKSTLLRCINGLEVPSSGEVLVEEKEVNALSKAELQQLRRKIGMLFQNFNLFLARDVYHNVAYPLTLDKLPKKEIKQKVLEILELVGLSDKVHAYPSQLSGGQKQRVALARALVSSPKILLLDEATSALDPETGERILKLIEEVKDQLDLTVVLITHDLSVVKSICTDVAILGHGQVQDQGRIAHMFRSSSLRDLLSDLVLPQGVLKKRGLALSFHHATATEPIISQLIREEQVDINILLGKIEYIAGESMGSLVIEVEFEDEEKVRRFLKERGVEVEVFYG